MIRNLLVGEKYESADLRNLGGVVVVGLVAKLFFAGERVEYVVAYGLVSVVAVAVDVGILNNSEVKNLGVAAFAELVLVLCVEIYKILNLCGVRVVSYNIDDIREENIVAEVRLLVVGVFGPCSLAVGVDRLNNNLCILCEVEKLAGCYGILNFVRVLLNELVVVAAALDEACGGNAAVVTV